MREILLHHFKKYPQMEIEDFIKLLYQSFFKGEHLFTDKEASLKMLEEEINSLDYELPFFIYEDIGFDTIRLNLSAVKANNLPLEEINEWFIKSFTKKRPVKDFKKSLRLLLSLIEKQEIKLDYQTSKEFITNYLKKVKPLSHSTKYKEKYNPHYRIIDKNIMPSYMKDLQFRNYIKNFKQGNRFNIIALDGKAASGKSTITKNLREHNVTIIHMDDFFLPKSLQTKKQLNTLGGNIDIDALKDVLSRLSQNQEIMFQAFNCKTQKYFEKREFVHSLVIIEGVFSYLEDFRRFYKRLIYLDINKQEQKKRLINRNKKLYPKFKKIWLPMEEKYFSKENIILKADLII
ncbi:MAG: AAA family ATPase [Bacilli bacterium]|nr:AAA family ATPase [Bacilli bacterium]